MEIKGKKLAFVVGSFPTISETWLINQVASLRDRGVEVEVFSLNRGAKQYISEVYETYAMAAHTRYLDMPKNIAPRIVAAIPKAFRMLRINPAALVRALNVKRYGRQALSLQLLFWAEPFLGEKFDLYHCHYGSVAVRFLDIRYVLGLRTTMITSFYGRDVSQLFEEKGQHYYDALKKESSLFIVMSNFMKERVVKYGFDPDKIRVVPIFGIDVAKYPFKERTLTPGTTVEMGAVGRFVEKKGFDDLLKALAIVKRKTTKNFNCTIVGDGPLHDQLHQMAKELAIEDVVTYTGYMKQEEMVARLMNMHLYLQPSKTASDGDME